MLFVGEQLYLFSEVKAARDVGGALRTEISNVKADYQKSMKMLADWSGTVQLKPQTQVEKKSK